MEVEQEVVFVPCNTRTLSSVACQDPHKDALDFVTLQMKLALSLFQALPIVQQTVDVQTDPRW